MKVFISWSGEKSKAIAEILRSWLPGVLQAVRPYYSPDDIAKGTRWSTEIAKELEASRVGLICLTADNLTAPWIMFEAGALSKNLDRSRVCPLLFGIEPSDIEGPLVQFQACKFSWAEIERVVTMMNGELGDAALAPNVLESVLGMWWPKLEQSIAAEMAKKQAPNQSARSERDLLEEILALTRSAMRSNRENVHPAAVRDLETRFAHLIRVVGTDGIDQVREAVRELSKPIDYLVHRGMRPRELDELRRRRSAEETLLDLTDAPIDPKGTS